MDLTDAQWAVLQPFLHPKPVRKRGRPWQDARAVPLTPCGKTNKPRRRLRLFLPSGDF